jgi:hypothetical protein
VCPYELLYRVASELDLFRGFLPRPWLVTPREHIEDFFDLGELDLFDLAYTGRDSTGMYIRVFTRGGTLDKWERNSYTAFVYSVSHSAVYPDPRSRLRALLRRMLHRKSLHLATPHLPVMNRFTSAQKALETAQKNGQLIPGRFNTCAIAAIMSASGVEDLRWIRSLEHHVYGRPLPEDTPSFEYYASLTGFSPHELLEIEAAFEGGETKLEKGNRRLAGSRPSVPSERRVEWTMGTLARIEFLDEIV